MSAEEWRPIEGFPGYEVSDLGRVRTLSPRHFQRIMAQHQTWAGYQAVTLATPDRRRINQRVHRLVAEAFLGPRPAGLDTCHTDGDKSNNTPSNLRYDSRSENEFDKVRHGTHHQTKKTHCPSGHPYDETNTVVRSSGRRCVICERAINRASYRRQQLRAAGIAS